MPTSRTGELAQAIIGLCRSKDGRSTQEISDILDRNRNSTGVYISDLTRARILFKGGAGKIFRFFTDEAAASAYTAQALVDLQKQKEAAAERQRESDRRCKRTKAEERKAQGLAPYGRKPAKVDLVPRDSGLVIATKQQEIDHKRFHAQANIVWPPNVKITIIPTGVDTRFVALVEPGKGQISQDQRARWKAERHAR